MSRQQRFQPSPEITSGGVRSSRADHSSPCKAGLFLNNSASQSIKIRTLRVRWRFGAYRMESGRGEER